MNVGIPSPTRPAVHPPDDLLCVPGLSAGSEDGVLLGRSAAMRAVFTMIRRLSRSSSTPVLIEGESGTGKELVARAVHATSGRREQPFVAVNCAALSESLIESELFGYEKGAFTGAAATGKAGLFEAADGGTIFLDEIGEMGFALQAKLLRVLQDQRFLRVGGTTTVRVDVRVVASTNRELAACVREGTFREDLFFRLKVVAMRTPPLRERTEDIVPLARHFLARFAAQFGRQFDGFAPEAEQLLLTYSWPGNVRELKNAIESCVILDPGEPPGRRLSLGTVQASVGTAGVLAAGGAARSGWRTRGEARSLPEDSGGQPHAPDLSLAALERRHIQRVLHETLWQRGLAAQLLGIHRTTLANKIREYGLDQQAGGPWPEPRAGCSPGPLPSGLVSRPPSPLVPHALAPPAAAASPGCA